MCVRRHRDSQANDSRDSSGELPLSDHSFHSSTRSFLARGISSRTVRCRFCGKENGDGAVLTCSWWYLVLFRVWVGLFDRRRLRACVCRSSRDARARGIDRSPCVRFFVSRSSDSTKMRSIASHGRERILRYCSSRRGRRRRYRTKRRVD